MTSQVDLAYIAGFFDGEGHCGLGRGKTKAGNALCYQPNVTIVNTNQALLRQIQQILSLGFVVANDNRKPNWKIAYRLYMPQTHIVKFLQMILPYLKAKRRQAELLIEFCETLKSVGFDLTESQVSRRAAIYHELAALNERGS